MKKRLIISLDFSDYADHLLRYARGLVLASDAEVVIVHQSTVIAPSLTDVDTRREIAKQTNAENLGKFKSLLREFDFPSGNLRFDIGDQHLMITLEKLLEEPYDHLLLMGVKGTGTFKKIFLGSNVVSAIQHLDCKILALPKDVLQVAPEKFLVGVNPRFPLNSDQLESLMGFYEGRIKELVFFTVLSASEAPAKMESFLNDLARQFEGAFPTRTHLILEGDVAEHTRTLMYDHPNSLVVLQRGSRYFSDLVFRKMLINDLVYEGKVPLAVLP
jgi:nucleotide-binding universal stress UspA family protein